MAENAPRSVKAGSTWSAGLVPVGTVVATIRAEVAKLGTLPSVWITLTLTWAVTLLLRLAELPGSVLVHTQAGFLVLGVLAATQEHDRGRQIHATLLAMPRRATLTMAKALALLALTVPFAAVTAATAGAPGAAGYLTFATLAACGAGLILRHGVVAAGVVLTAYLIVVPLVRARLPDVAAVLPAGPVTGAGGENGQPAGGEVTAWIADVDPASAAWALVALGGAAMTLRYLDT
ncbi:hypothetical protein [Actinoplanes sp. DH11]|uniref:hypothetical protein n=1 Tax=Actinoplanes sp. DH11 TaxID=2857011 RepID=UPI001E50008E|nr:hypothetical protein [Actinoplanes sp. DH11]